MSTHTHDIVEQLKLFAIDHDLPKTDMALFGTLCPYCGKADRIRPLEHPDELPDTINGKELTAYTGFWERFAASGGSLGVCKFCQNPLRLNGNGRAEQLV